MLPCPRREETPFNRTDPNEDRWQSDGTCNYCGSMNPDDFFKAIEAGAEIGPTDKNYKVYVSVPNPLAGKPACYTTSTHPRDGFILLTEELADTITWETPEDRASYVGRYVKLGGAHSNIKQFKFYFQHLDQAGMDRYIALHNDRKIKYGYPGQLYVKPFFASFKTTTASPV